MSTACVEPLPLYRPRDPQASDLWRLLDEHFASFQQVYDERYQANYGYWRPIVQQSVAAFLKCGDLQEGFARVRCPDCYWNKSRGMVKKAEAEASAESSSEDAISATTATRSSQTWAMLIKRVYEVDPLCCPQCGGQMKVVAFRDAALGRRHRSYLEALWFMACVNVEGTTRRG